MSSQLEQGNNYIISSEYDGPDPLYSDGPLYWEVIGNQDKWDAVQRGDRFGDRYGKIVICQLIPIGTPDEVRDKLRAESIKFVDSYVPVFERDTIYSFDATGCFMPEMYKRNTALYDLLEFVKNYKDNFGKCLICEIKPIGTVSECKELMEKEPF